jgi:hypothetical protein
LRKYLLVFFDDILIYSRTWDEHLEHFKEVLGIVIHRFAQAGFPKEPPKIEQSMLI